MGANSHQPRWMRRLALTAAAVAGLAVGIAFVPGPAVAETPAVATRAAETPAVATRTAAKPEVAAPGFAVPATVAGYCPTAYWGSLAKTTSGSTTQPVVAVRTGTHRCFDRVVVDLAGSGSGRVGFDVRYVPAVHREGSGAVVPLRGAADLQVVVRAPAYSVSSATTTFRPANPNRVADVTGYQALRQVAYAGSFEGQTTFGIGVRARLPVRAFVLPGPGSGHRLVIDIYDRW